MHEKGGPTTACPCGDRPLGAVVLRRGGQGRRDGGYYGAKINRACPHLREIAKSEFRWDPAHPIGLDHAHAPATRCHPGAIWSLQSKTLSITWYRQPALLLYHSAQANLVFWPSVQPTDTRPRISVENGTKVLIINNRRDPFSLITSKIFYAILC